MEFMVKLGPLPAFIAATLFLVNFGALLWFATRPHLRLVPPGLRRQRIRDDDRDFGRADKSPWYLPACLLMVPDFALFLYFATVAIDAI